MDNKLRILSILFLISVYFLIVSGSPKISLTSLITPSSRKGSNSVAVSDNDWQNYGAVAAVASPTHGNSNGLEGMYEYSVEPYNSQKGQNSAGHHSGSNGIISTQGAEFSEGFIKSILYGLKVGLTFGILLGVIKLMIVGFPILSILLSLLFFLKGYTLGIGPTSLFPSIFAKFGQLATTPMPATTVAPQPPIPYYAQDHYYT